MLNLRYLIFRSIYPTLRNFQIYSENHRTNDLCRYENKFRTLLEEKDGFTVFKIVQSDSRPHSSYRIKLDHPYVLN